jgi:hypothetical protein
MRSKLWCAFAVSAGTLIGVPAASAAAPPTNDAFAAAAPLVTSTDSVRSTIDEATVEAGEPDHGGQSVWYVFRPTESRRVVVELMNGQNLSPVTSVYTGASVSALQRVGQARNFRARVPFEAVAGQTYFIAVATQAPPPSPPNSRFQLRLRNMPLPANDAFADAKPISIPGKYRGNAADATAELGEDESHSHSLWYRFRPRRTVNLTIDWIRGYCSGGVKLYTGSRLTSLRKVGDGPPIRLKALRGRLYHLAVDCYIPSLGDFIVTLSDGSIKGKGVKLAVDDGQTVDSVRARGLRMTVTAERRVGVGIELKVSRATADRLGLKSRVLGTAQGPVNYNRSLPVDLRLTRAARRALADTEHLKATVRLEILRSDAPNRVLTVPVSL